MMDAKILTASEVEAIENSAIRSMYKRIPYVYTHGQLAEDMCTDVVYLFKGDNNMCNGLKYAIRWHPGTSLASNEFYTNEKKTTFFKKNR